MRSCGTLVAVTLALIAAAPALACAPPSPPPADNPLVQRLPDSYWANNPAWLDLPFAERDLLVRVSIAQRDRRAWAAGARFSTATPLNIAPLATDPTLRFVSEGAPALDALILDARRDLTAIDPRIEFGPGSALRRFDQQLTGWVVNLVQYLGELRGELAPLRDATGRYSDEAMCKLRAHAGARYGFPGFSNHQAGNAIDFYHRTADGTMLLTHTDRLTIARWCASPGFAWLRANAARYGFVQVGIDEPWHWVFDPAAARDPASAGRIAPSCRGVAPVLD